MKLMEYYEYLVTWVQEEVKKAKCDGVIVGISGGIDSALVATIAKQAFGDKALGVIMPIESNENDAKDALSLVSKLKMKFEYIELTETYQKLKELLPIGKRIALANIKPRLRMTTLYAFAQENNYLVLGTDNYAESFLGYFTKYGDGGVDLLPIVHLTKGEVRQMAKELGIPKTILEKAPSAGLWENQTDEAELGFTYADFDQYVKDKSQLSQDIVKKIEHQHQITEHKRIKIPSPKEFER